MRAFRLKVLDLDRKTIHPELPDLARKRVLPKEPDLDQKKPLQKELDQDRKKSLPKDPNLEKIDLLLERLKSPGLERRKVHGPEKVLEARVQKRVVRPDPSHPTPVLLVPIGELRAVAPPPHCPQQPSARVPGKLPVTQPVKSWPRSLMRTVWRRGSGRRKAGNLQKKIRLSTPDHNM